MPIAQKTLCICGGGSLGHVIAGTASFRGFRVNLFSPRAETWQDEIVIRDCNGKLFNGKLEKKSAFPEEVIASSDIVLLCVPGFLIRSTLEKIVPYLREGAAVGSVVSSSGFFFEAQDILPKTIPIFGFQRVPYIARTIEYGKCAELLGYKNELRLATENFDSADSRESFRVLVEKIFETPVSLLNSFWEAALTNSNPLLHPCRLYGMWSKWDGKTVYEQCPRFYEDWDDFSSETLVAADEEFFALLEKLPVTSGAIPRLLDYYECSDASALTRKMKSIPAFKKILAPMLSVPGGFIPDVNNRYFTEDIPFGMQIIKKLAAQHGIVTPTIDAVLSWAKKMGV